MPCSGRFASRVPRGVLELDEIVRAHYSNCFSVRAPLRETPVPQRQKEPTEACPRISYIKQSESRIHEDE